MYPFIFNKKCPFYCVSYHMDSWNSFKFCVLKAAVIYPCAVFTQSIRTPYLLTIHVLNLVSKYLLDEWQTMQTLAPEVINFFSCSTQLSMNFVLLINLKLLTSANSFLHNMAEHENFSANKYENDNFCWHFHIYLQRKFHAQLNWAWKKFYNLGAWSDPAFFLYTSGK